MTTPSKHELVERALTEARLACLPGAYCGARDPVRFEPCRHLAIFLLCCLRLIGEADYVYFATTCQLFGPQNGGHDRDPQVGSYDFPIVGSRFIRPGVATSLTALQMFGHADPEAVAAALGDVGASANERDEAGRTVSRMLASAVMES